LTLGALQDFLSGAVRFESFFLRITASAGYEYACGRCYTFPNIGQITSVGEKIYERLSQVVTNTKPC